MGDEFPKPKRPTLILVMGLHVSGGKELSDLISGWAKCPWLDHEVILKSLSKEAGYHHPDNLPSEEEIARLKRVSFDITCSSALFQLSKCAPTECVIISSNLISYASQLHGLLNLVQHLQPCRLLIIQSLRRNKFKWQRYFEQDGSQLEWYQPNSWEDVEKAILNQDRLNASLLTLLQPRRRGMLKQRLLLRLMLRRMRQMRTTSVDAIKLVLDPDEDLITRDYIIYASKLQLSRRSLFAEAIKDLLTCDHVGEYGDGSHVVDYPAWRRKRLEELGRTFASRVTTQHYWCQPGDCIFRLTHNPCNPDDQQQEATCEICDGNIASTEQAYYCQFCSLSFHQACCCASPTSTEMSMLVHVFDSIKDMDNIEIFAETHACYKCIREEKGFSWSCDSCIYRTTLKSRLLSPVLRHPCDHNHILTMRLQSTTNIRYDCKACERQGSKKAYSCNICGREYHMECLHLPLEMEHQHGGHLHRINMEFSCPAKEGEYEWCLCCYKDVNPQTWVYTCQDCDYVAHLYCVFPFLSKQFRPNPLER